MPRYARNPCCGDSGHVTNQGEKDFYEEFLGAEQRLLDAAAVGDRTREAKVIDLCKLFGSAETPPQDLTTPDGTSVWAGQPAMGYISPRRRTEWRRDSWPLSWNVLLRARWASQQPRGRGWRVWFRQRPRRPPNRSSKRHRQRRNQSPHPCGCLASYPQTTNSTATGTAGSTRTTVEAEDMEEGVEGEAADAAATAENTSFSSRKL